MIKLLKKFDIFLIAVIATIICYAAFGLAQLAEIPIRANFSIYNEVTGTVVGKYSYEEDVITLHDAHAYLMEFIKTAQEKTREHMRTLPDSNNLVAELDNVMINGEIAWPLTQEEEIYEE